MLMKNIQSHPTEKREESITFINAGRVENSYPFRVSIEIFKVTEFILPLWVHSNKKLKFFVYLSCTESFSSFFIQKPINLSVIERLITFFIDLNLKVLSNTLNSSCCFGDTSTISLYCKTTYKQG